MDYVFNGQGTEHGEPDCRDYNRCTYIDRPDRKENLSSVTCWKMSLLFTLPRCLAAMAKTPSRRQPTWASPIPMVCRETEHGNNKQIYISKAFTYGFLVLSDVAKFCYRVTDFCYLEDEDGLDWNSPEIGM